MICIILGSFLLILGILSVLSGDTSTGLPGWAHENIGNWAFWMIFLGCVLLFPGVYYLFMFVKRLKEFKKLMETNSKAIFIKNQDRIEELAWRLHPKYERMVIRKKEKLKVR